MTIDYSFDNQVVIHIRCLVKMYVWNVLETDARKILVNILLYTSL